MFDQIDAGIGGVTAHAVAETLQRLAERAQVLRSRICRRSPASPTGTSGWRRSPWTRRTRDRGARRAPAPRGARAHGRRRRVHRHAAGGVADVARVLVTDVRYRQVDRRSPGRAARLPRGRGGPPTGAGGIPTETTGRGEWLWREDRMYELQHPKQGVLTSPAASRTRAFYDRLMCSLSRSASRSSMRRRVLVVLDHLAPHVDAKPLLVDVELVAVENSFTGKSGCARSPARTSHSSPERYGLEVRRRARRDEASAEVVEALVAIGRAVTPAAAQRWSGHRRALSSAERVRRPRVASRRHSGSPTAAGTFRGRVEE